MQACSCEAPVKERSFCLGARRGREVREKGAGRGMGGRGEGEQAPGDSEGLRTSNPQDSTWTQPLCEISSGPRLSATVYNLHLPLNSLPFVRVLIPFLTPVHANAYVYAYVRRYVHVILRTIPGIAAQLYAVAAYTRGPRPLPPPFSVACMYETRKVGEIVCTVLCVHECLRENAERRQYAP